MPARSDQDASVRMSVLENQVDTINDNVEKLENKIDSNYAILHSRISDLRDDLREDIDKKHEKIVEKLDDQYKSSAEQHKVIADRIHQIEKWRWMIMGGAMAIGYFLAHVNIGKFFGG